MEEIGTVAAIWRYPVKGMRGNSINNATLTHQGFKNDREYMVVDVEKWQAGRSGRITARDAFARDLLLYETDVNGRCYVTSPEGKQYSIEDKTLHEHLSKKFGREVGIHRETGGHFDLRPISILSKQTVDALSEEYGSFVDYRRFRPNLLLDCPNQKPFWESSLVGRTLHIGEEVTLVGAPGELRGVPCNGISRCAFITLDPDTAVPDPLLLKHIAQQHGNIVGVYANINRLGQEKEKRATTVSADMPVYVSD